MSPATSPLVLQLDATPTTWLAAAYDVRGGSGGTARLKFRWLEEQARLDVGGRRYQIRHEPSPFGSTGTYLLECRGRRLASASKPSEFSRAFVLDHGSGQWELRARPMRRAFKVLHRGRRVGEIEPAAWYKRHARLAIPDGVPEDLGYFLMVLVLFWWRRKRIA